MKKLEQAIKGIIVYILAIGLILSLILGFLYAIVKIFDLAENPNADYTLIIAFLTLIIPVWFGTWYSKKLEFKNESLKNITVDKQQFIKKIIDLSLKILGENTRKSELELLESDILFYFNQTTYKSILEFLKNINKTTFNKMIINLKKEKYR